MTEMILYNKRKVFYFRNHVVTDHKSIRSHFISYMGAQPNILGGNDASSLEGTMYTPLSRHKMPNNESSCTSIKEKYFVRKNIMVLIILIRWSIRITWR